MLAHAGQRDAGVLAVGEHGDEIADVLGAIGEPVEHHEHRPRRARAVLVRERAAVAPQAVAHAARHSAASAARPPPCSARSQAARNASQRCHASSGCSARPDGDRRPSPPSAVPDAARAAARGRGSPASRRKRAPARAASAPPSARASSSASSPSTCSRSASARAAPSRMPSSSARARSTASAASSSAPCQAAASANTSSRGSPRRAPPLPAGRRGARAPPTEAAATPAARRGDRIPPRERANQRKRRAPHRRQQPAGPQLPRRHRLAADAARHQRQQADQPPLPSARGAPPPPSRAGPPPTRPAPPRRARAPATRSARPRAGAPARRRSRAARGGAPPPVRLHRRRQRRPGVGGQLVPSRTRARSAVTSNKAAMPGISRMRTSGDIQQREGGQPAHPARAGDPECEPARKHHEQPGRDHDADQDRRGGAQRALRPRAHRRADVPQHRPPERVHTSRRTVAWSSPAPAAAARPGGRYAAASSAHRVDRGPRLAAPRWSRRRRRGRPGRAPTTRARRRRAGSRSSAIAARTSSGVRSRVPNGVG